MSKSDSHKNEELDRVGKLVLMAATASDRRGPNRARVVEWGAVGDSAALAGSADRVAAPDRAPARPGRTRTGGARP